MITLYNTLSRSNDTLPADQKKIRLFVCGPTVYNYLHIGNARTYVVFDLFAKYLRARGYDAEYVQNITDIDDKIIVRAADEGRSAAEIAEQYLGAYLEDMRALGVDGVTTYARATDFISQIVAQVERLIDKEYAYRIDGDGWYFDISKDPDYGKLSGRTVAQAEDGVTRIDDAVGKRNKGDFCLWKFSKDGEPSWPSSLGSGRPGWHIEDTAISEFYFGPQYEIHGGGIDLKFPHHEAEIAQQESASGLVPFVKLWMHVGSLTVDGRKMSKSLGNFITIRDFLAFHAPASVLRWIIISHHYRAPFDYSEKTMMQARRELENLYALCLEAERDAGSEDQTALLSAWKEKFFDALDDDLDTPKALSVLFELLKDERIGGAAKLSFMREADSILGLSLASALQRASEIPAELVAKLEEYKQFRASKQFVQSDALRKEIESLGYEIRDTREGSALVKKFF